MAASIKTIMQMDNSDVQKKLDQLNKHYKSTYNEWVSSTEQLIQVDKKLIGAKQALTTANDKNTKHIKANIAELQKQKNAIKATQMARRAEYTSIKTGISELDKETKQYVKGRESGKKSTDSMTNSMVRHLRQIETLVIAYYTLREGFRSTFGVGIEVNKMIEDNTSGIAALLSANTQIVLSNGEVVNSYEKFQIGLGVASKTMESLKKASVDTYATFPQLTQLFQQSIGHTLAMGDSFGQTTDDIIANTIKLTQRISNIAGSIGMPMEKAQEEIRSLLSGNVSTDSLIAVMLFGSPTRANEAMREAKKRGTNGVKDMLDGMLKSFDVLADVDSYTRNLLKLENAWSNAMQKMSEPLFKDLTVTFKELAKAIEDNTDNIADSMQKIYESMKLVGNGGKQIFDAFDGFSTQIEELVGSASEPLVGLGAVVSATMTYISNGINTASLAILGYRLAWSKLTDSESEFKAFKESQREAFEGIIGNIKSQEEMLASAQNLGRKIREIGSEAPKSTTEVVEARVKFLKGQLEQLSKIQETTSSDRFAKATLQYGKEYTALLEKQVELGGKLQTKVPYDKEAISDIFKTIENAKSNEIKLNERIAKIQETITLTEKEKTTLLNANVNTSEKQAEVDKEIAAKTELIKSAKKSISILEGKITEEKEKQNKFDAKELVNLNIFDKTRTYSDWLSVANQKMIELATTGKYTAQELQKVWDVMDNIAPSGKEKRHKKEMTSEEVAVQIREKENSLRLDSISKEQELEQIQFERLTTVYDRKLKEGELNETQYDMLMEMERKVHNKKMYDISKTGQLTKTTTDAMKSGMVDFFDATSDGFMKIGDLAQDVLSQILRKMIEIQMVTPFVNAVTPAISAGFSSLGMGGSSYTPQTDYSYAGYAQFANGGIMTDMGSMPLNKYANGGVANTPQVAIFGEGRMNEAFVPLPDGRSIPVTMQGGGQTASSVVVNIENRTQQDMTSDMVSQSMQTNSRGELVKTVNFVIEGYRRDVNGLRTLMRGM